MCNIWVYSRAIRAPERGMYKPITHKMDTNFMFTDSLHPSSVLYNFSEFQSGDVLCDVTLSVDEEEIRAHKVVLAAASPFFRLMFISNMKEAIQEKVSLPDMEFKILQSIIKYIYSSQISVSEDNVYSLMDAADFLELPGLLFACQRYLASTMGPTNCLSVCARARLRHAHDLARLAFQHALDNFGKVAQEEEFLHAPADLLLDILSARTVHVTDEGQLLQSVVRWVRQDEETRTQHLVPLLARLQLQQVPVATLRSCRAATTLSGQAADILWATVDEALSSVLADKYDREAVAPRPSRRLLKRQRYFSEQEVILGIGGESHGTAMGSVECFTLGYDSWRCIVPTMIHESGGVADSTVVAAMSDPRIHAAMASADNLVYVAGGRSRSELLRSVECYSAETYTWRQLADLPAAVQGAGAAFVDGCLHVVGGVGSAGFRNTVWKFEETHSGNGAWKEAVPMTTHRAYHGVVCITGVLYALGGVCGSSAGRTEVLRTVERYNPLIGRWQPVASMHDTRSKFGCVSIDEFIYVVGGCVETYCYKTVEKYNTLTNEWSLLESMTVPRGDFGITVCFGRVYCMGGRDGIHHLNTVEKYNPHTNRWHCVTSMQMRRLGLVAATVRVPVIKDEPI